MIAFWILVGICVSMAIGAGVCAALDTEDQIFYKWYKSAPSILFPGIILIFWPVMAYFMIKYKHDSSPTNKTVVDKTDSPRT